MLRKLFIGLCLFLWLCSPAWAILATNGIPVDPHGFPLFYQDAGTPGLQLELCLDANGMCVVDPTGAEAFWWIADAQVRPLVAGGKAILVMGLEAAYSANGDVIDGNQISFARIRVRVDVAQPGHYLITHPYGVIDLPNVTVADGINYTEDIGAINPLDPIAAFAGALAGKIGPFLTWPNFATDPTLVDPVTGAQYIGDPGIAHTVVGSPLGTNFFRIERENPTNPGTFAFVDETNLFTVSGKVLSPTTPAVAHVFPTPAAPKLLAVGPVNRAAAFPAAGSNLAHPGGPAAVPEFTLNQPPPPNDYPAGTGYPIGYPYWYQDSPDDIPAIIASGVTPFSATPGLKLTICPGGDPMCISMPADPVAGLNVGDESFWWSADASVIGQGVDALLVMGLEGAFGGVGTVNEGDQIAFTRLRIRIDTPVAGDYTVTYPFGQIVFPGVPAGTRAINFTEDLGTINPAAPDTAFTGALFGNIPRFLTWTTFNPDPALTDPTLVIPNAANALAPFLYIGNPVILHAVTGSPLGTNFFRVQGPGIDVQTDLFTVQGKVYSPATFVPPPPVAGLVAVADAVTLTGGAATVINVLANDTFTLPVTVELLPQATFGPADGLAVVNADNTVTYTPAAGFTGVDSFTYRINAGGLLSNNATVTITVDNMTVDRAELDLRRLTWNIKGTAAPGAVLTLNEGPNLGGAGIGSVLVAADGKWQFRGRALSAPTATSISVVSSTGTQLLNQPLRIR
jgi:hypothetical protein